MHCINTSICFSFSSNVCLPLVYTLVITPSIRPGKYTGHQVTLRQKHLQQEVHLSTIHLLVLLGGTVTC